MVCFITSLNCLYYCYANLLTFTHCWGAGTFFSSAPHARLRLPPKKVLDLGSLVFINFFHRLRLWIPLQRSGSLTTGSRLLEAIFRSFYRPRLLLNRFNGSGSCYLYFLTAPAPSKTARLPNTAFTFYLTFLLLPILCFINLLSHYPFYFVSLSYSFSRYLIHSLAILFILSLSYSFYLSNSI